jgi:hypothetical protein
MERLIECIDEFKGDSEVSEDCLLSEPIVPAPPSAAEVFSINCRRVSASVLLPVFIPGGSPANTF